MTDNPQISDEEAIARSKIGRHVTYFALTVTGLLGFVAILVAINETSVEKRFIYVKDILTIVLPLIGTWVGTVLAFYFSRENFVAASRQTADLVRQLTPEQRLQSIPVTEVMLDMTASTTTKLLLSTPGDAEKIKLKTDLIEALLEKNNRNRLPIVDSAGKALFVLHRSFIDKFLVKLAQGGGTSLADATLKDLLAQEELKTIFQSFATVGKDAKLIAIKLAMDGNPNCSDAFVTEDGTKGSKALGWITNVIVQEKSVA
ncbi:hypothetical protein [Thauera aminoaromatica]|jgi:hypothetical protein|uniref:CBS domain-containing protein n=1 Tax=Thauera aminoaromatica TaxID=164330 RepID=B8F0B8_THASP|nr:hypothetical protein [Thauera aminoaromatica]ACK55084.1 hypothetical protein Tmz1t_2348 [Thauera aminoaromatica]